MIPDKETRKQANFVISIKVGNLESQVVGNRMDGQRRRISAGMKKLTHRRQLFHQHFQWSCSAHAHLRTQEGVLEEILSNE